MTEKEMLAKAWSEGFDKCGERVSAALILASTGGVTAAMTYLNAIGPAKNPYHD